MYQAPVVRAALESRSRQLEPDLSDYTSGSFFDDYDEEDELDSEVDPESDDDFDETTLWEIASMLKTTDLPSKNSLLPPMSSQQIVDDHDDYETSSETDFSSEAENYEEFNNENYEGHGTEARNSVVIFSQDDMDFDDEVSDHTMEPFATFHDESDENSFYGAFEPQDDSLGDLTTYSMLWSNTTSLNNKEPGYGLPQPTSDIWQSYIPISHNTFRPKSRPSPVISNLTSNKLWGENEEDISDEYQPVAHVHSEPEPLPTTARILTWTPPAAFVEVLTPGLFSLEARGHDLRSTSEIPAAINLKKAQRIFSSELPRLSSKVLWAPQEFASSASKIWMLMDLDKPTRSSVAITPVFMWTPRAVVADVATQGLFETTSSRVNYRTTKLEPAALLLASKARSASGVLSMLSSNKLWRQPCLLNLQRDHDWISESSIRPSSPSIASEMSSGRSSPDISDASSIASTSTKASSLFYLGPISIRRSLSIKKKGEIIPPPPPPVDPSKYQSKLPVRQVSLKPPPKLTPMASPSMQLRQSKVLSSRDLFEARIPPGVGKPQLPRFRRSVLPMKPAKPTHRAIRHQYRATVAFRANWEDALNEAIIAGSQGAHEYLDTTTIPEVIVQKLRIADPLVSTEVIDILESSSSVTTEISTGSLYSAVYNPVLLHPVFFTEKLISDVDNVHPAAIGHTKLLRLTASFDDWDRALGKAISKSKQRIQRPAVFSFMWKDALKEAIAAGISKRDTRTKRPRVSTFMSDDALKEAMATEVTKEEIARIQRPAASSLMWDAALKEAIVVGIAEEADTCIFNSAVLHPVFFATTLISNGVDIHPASIGHTMVTSSRPMVESRLWTPKSLSMTSVVTSGMWIKRAILVQEGQELLKEPASMCPRRIIEHQGLELSLLESHQLWQPSQVPIVPRDWLQRSKKPSVSYRSLFEKPVSTVASQHKALMWELSPKTVNLVQDMFADIKREYIRRSATAHSLLLPPLESNELYTVSETTGSEINWLTSSIVKPVIIAKDVSKMWTSNRSLTLDLFSNVVYEPSKRAISSRSSALPRLESSQLFVLLEKQHVEIDWLRISSKSISGAPRKVLMWEAASISPPHTLDLFANIKVDRIKRVSNARNSELPRLDTINLFTIQDKTEAEINWLRVSVASKVAVPRKSMLWARSTISTPDLFSEFKADHVERTSRVRTAFLPRLTSTRLFATKTESKAEIDWLHQSTNEPMIQENKDEYLIDRSIQQPIIKELDTAPTSTLDHTFEELMADIETLTEEQIAELLEADRSPEEEYQREQRMTDGTTIEELMADIETLTEEQIAELIGTDEFLAEEESRSEKISDELSLDQLMADIESMS